MFGLQKIPVYCHMGNFGCGDGGWTLAVKIDGTKVRKKEVKKTLEFGNFLSYGNFSDLSLMRSVQPIRKLGYSFHSLVKGNLYTGKSRDFQRFSSFLKLSFVTLQKTFHYSSHFWSDRNVYNLAGGKTGFDKQETKLPTYWDTHFSKICLGMRIGHNTRFVVINRSANSLYALIADGKYRALSLGRSMWKSLIGSQGSLQNNCNKEGFNVQSDDKKHSETRIGILGNNENDCTFCDSRIGFGSGGLHDDSNTCGNEAMHASDNGNKHIKSMGYILVQ